MRVEVAVDDALLVQMVGRSGNIEREAVVRSAHALCISITCARLQAAGLPGCENGCRSATSPGHWHRQDGAQSAQDRDQAGVLARLQVVISDIGRPSLVMSPEYLDG